MRAIAFMLLLAAPLLAQSAATPSERLHALFDSEWDYDMQQHPTRASMLGDRRWNDQWGDVSLAAIEARHQHNLGVIEQLKAIDRAQLPPADQTNYDLFRRRYLLSVEGHKFHWYLPAQSARGRPDRRRARRRASLHHRQGL